MPKKNEYQPLPDAYKDHGLQCEARDCGAGVSKVLSVVTKDNRIDREAVEKNYWSNRFLCTDCYNKLED